MNNRSSLFKPTKYITTIIDTTEEIQTVIDLRCPSKKRNLKVIGKIIDKSTTGIIGNITFLRYSDIESSTKSLIITNLAINAKTETIILTNRVTSGGNPYVRNIYDIGRINKSNPPTTI